MTQKKFQKDTKFSEYDLDGDGIITDKEIEQEERMIRVRDQDLMANQQRYICWVSSITSIGLILLSMSPLIPDNRIEMVTALLSTYVVANLGIVSVFMGATAWTRAKENGKG
tara:strand:+ start:1589 stop:1924 length:336 start_codon:yes stop_codon:yes gene_type:complete